VHKKSQGKTGKQGKVITSCQKIARCVGSFDAGIILMGFASRYWTFYSGTLAVLLKHWYGA